MSLAARAVHKEHAGTLASEEFILTYWSARYRRRRKGLPDQVVTGNGTDAESFWQWLSKRAGRRRRVWIFAVNAGEAFTILGGYRESTRGRIGWGNLTGSAKAQKSRSAGSEGLPRCTLIPGPNPVILTHTLSGARFTWVSTTNYTAATIRELGKSVGIDYEDIDQLSAGAFAYQTDPDRACVIIDDYFNQWMQEHVSDDRGHWRETSAGLAKQYWRRKCYTHSVLEHKDERASVLERRGLWGGRQELYFRGTVGTVPFVDAGGGKIPAARSPVVVSGPCYKFDVRSMYVHLMATKLFPIVLQKSFAKIKFAQMRAAAECRGIIADVTIDTPEPLYPCRIRFRDVTAKQHVDHEWRTSRATHGTRVVYPIGRFRTILAGPELSHAVRCGHVVAVRSAALYRLMPAFKSFASAMLERRRVARAAGELVREQVAKLTGNALPGKLAARGGGWITRKDKPAKKRWGEWVTCSMDDEQPREFRAIDGIVQEFVRPDDEPRACPAILAYLTSYGRRLLWTLIATAGAGNVIHCDTDGMIVNGEGRDNLMASNHYSEDEPGKVRFEGEIWSFRGWTPKHFIADHEIVLGGFRSGAWFGSDGSIMSWATQGVSGVLADPKAGTGKHALRKSAPPGLLDRTRIDADGFIAPLHLTGLEPWGERGETIV